MGAKLETAIGILNGTIGDYLARTGNGLATEMQCVQRGEAIRLDRGGLESALPEATARIALLVHGVMGTERDWAMPDGRDYGSMLARDLGFTPVYVRYNSGRAIPENGAALADVLRRLWEAYPVRIAEILPIGYSMGGLVVRSAFHAAGLSGAAWLERVRRAVYIGTPHQGAPQERLGRIVARALAATPDPVARLVARVANLRSAGVKDLGDAVLRAEDRAPPEGARDLRHPVPLPRSVKHYLVAGTLSGEHTLAALLGDAVVPLASATDGGCVDRASFALPPGHVKLLPGVGHMALAHHPLVYEQIRSWCACEEAA